MNEKSKKIPSPYKSFIYIIDNEREMLYNRIDKRVDVMMEQGLLNEVKMLLDMGINESCTSMQAIGYKEIVRYLNGEISKELYFNFCRDNAVRIFKLKKCLKFIKEAAKGSKKYNDLKANKVPREAFGGDGIADVIFAELDRKFNIVESFAADKAKSE